EQVLIAGCQSQAIKLLTPEPLKITPLTFPPFPGDNNNAPVGNFRVLLLTNKQIMPVHLRIQCNVPVEGVSVDPIGVGGGFNSYGLPKRLGSNAWDADLESSWSPTEPIMAMAQYRLPPGQTAADVRCGFARR
ncbi:MAG TPA: hypothetical protein VK638_46025, partial [Edaphobacter sp.]|nr:hypothetical protein [Edaphobacter sp.]